MTDEQKLHKMMANPGPAPVYDANGFPIEMVDGPTYDAIACALEEQPIRDPQIGMVYRVACPHGKWDGFDPRRALQHATRWHANPPTRVPGEPTAVWQLRRVTDSAGAAPSSASTSGTGGDGSGETEDRHREAWHQLVEAWRGIEFHPTSSNSAHMQRRYAEGQLAMYLLFTGQAEDMVLPEIGRALDDRYGTDRNKRGVPC